jgi:hypothetical protein
MAFSAPVFLKICKYSTTSCSDLLYRISPISHNKEEKYEYKLIYIPMPSMAFTTTIFHETHKPSVNFCGHLLYQIVLKFDKNIENTRKFHLHPYECHWVHFYKTHTSSKFLSRNPKPNLTASKKLPAYDWKT